MSISVWQILVLATVQGLCELLPVSSSAHVILAEKLMGIDPTAPAMTLLLVMLHTGTMFAVILYFWRSWRDRYFRSRDCIRQFVVRVMVATAATGGVGLALLVFIERVIMRDSPHPEIEQLFGNVYVISGGLAAAGAMIIAAAKRAKPVLSDSVGLRASAWIGITQGFCLPFRGFSRSGATISAGLLSGLERSSAEEFSFALAVVLTPAAIGKELYRALATREAIGRATSYLLPLLWPSLIAMFFSFAAGLIALWWLSSWLEHGRWQWFGYYCLLASVAVLAAFQFL